MFYPSRRDLLITLGALAGGVAIGEPAPHFHGMTDSITSQPNTGEIDPPMITTKDGTQILYKDWGPKNAQPIVFHHGWPCLRTTGRSRCCSSSPKAIELLRMTGAVTVAHRRWTLAMTWTITHPTPRQ